jgi:uncharacterized OB-fold protein
VASAVRVGVSIAVPSRFFQDLARRQRADPARLQIGRRIDREDTRHGTRRRGVDTPDRPMRMVAAHHHGIGLTGEADIVAVAPRAAQQHRVFRARHRLPDGEPLVKLDVARIDIVVHGSPLHCLCVIRGSWSTLGSPRSAATSPTHQPGNRLPGPISENDAMSETSDWKKATRPIPVPNEWTKPFWDAARRGILELQRCQSCGHFQHPPYATCTQCVATDLRFEPVRGIGTIYAYTIMYHTGDKRFASAVPYASIIVELDDAPGALLAGNLLEAPYTEAKVGRRVEVIFEKLNDDITLPQFRLARAG